MQIKIPKGAQPKCDHIRALTARIKKLQQHFAHGAERFHDGRAKRLFERLLHKRGLAMASLRECDPELHQRLTAEMGGQSE